MPNPTSHYAESKLEIENLLRNTVPNHTILRFGTAYGLSDIVPRNDLLINAIIQSVRTKREFDIYSLYNMRPYIHFKDIARGIMFALKNSITGTYNLSVENMNISDLLSIITEAGHDTSMFNVNATLAAFNEDKRHYSTDSSAFMNLGFKPEHTIKNTVRVEL